ncbi:hypothetical protein PENSPDRAFT_338645 [Peniophora sp. CONT]|nr:hypothetical protein PENSPDRAFT_338645 [Peniophora sp. CONT]
MDVATSSIQDLPYLDTLSRGLDNFSRLSCDYCKPRWKAIGTVARKMQALVDVVRGMVVNITDQGQKPLPASLAEVFRGVEGCIMQALVVFCACQVQSKRRRDIALSYIKAGDLGKNVRECEKEFRAMYKLLKERLGVADAWSNLSNLTEGRKNQLANMALHSEPTVTDVSITTAADILDHDSGPSDTARDAATSILSDLDTLWLGALDEYKRRQSPDDVQSFYKFTSALPEKGVTTELVLNLLDNAQADARMRRRGKERLPRPIKDVLTAVLDGLSVILDTGAETASSFGVPGGKGIFAAVAVLLQAANRASATLDELEKLLRYSAMYIEHLRIRIQGRALGSEARSLAIKGLVAILKTMDMATKSLREGTFKSFLKAMFTKAKDHVSTARQDLQDIIDEEGRLIMIEGFRDVWIQLSDAVYEVRQIRAAQEMQVRESLPRGQGPLPQNGLVISNDVMAKVDQHSVMLAELLRRHPSGPSTPVWPDLIHNMLGHFSPEDRDRILAMFGALLSAAAACVSMSSGGTDGALGAQLAITQEPGLVLMAFIPMAFSFLFLYTGWKLRSVARSIGAPPGVITILDVFGTPLPPISEEIFSSPSKTYDYARQMMLKQGLRIPYWRLGTSKTIALDPNAEKWDEDIKPGTVLNMSVVVYSYASACPYCQTVSTTRERNGDLIFW